MTREQAISWFRDQAVDVEHLRSTIEKIDEIYDDFEVQQQIDIDLIGHILKKTLEGTDEKGNEFLNFEEEQHKIDFILEIIHLFKINYRKHKQKKIS